MRIVSFNVNSVRIRLHQLEAVIHKHNPDFIGLQETKVTDEEFPVEAINALGYEVIYYGQKTHYGVALLSRIPAIKPMTGFDSDIATTQRRMVAGQFSLADGRTLSVFNGYFPQGENQTHAEKYPNKRAYYRNLYEWLSEHHQPEDPVIVMGDVNVAAQDIDIGIGEPNRKRWLRDGKCSFLPEEREWLQHVMNWGMIDTFRQIHPTADDMFSWFDYRSKGFDREPRRGLRIDMIMASTGICATCLDSGIDYDIRGMEKPSDHCPIWSEFDLKLA